MRKSIYLPVIDQIVITGYQTYTSATNGGVLHHDFVDGVNLVVGVNGLGKTTLLRLMHRVLAGPSELRSSDELGQGQRDIRPIARVGRLFADRVPDGAKNASAKVTFRIGSKAVEITRRLDTLKITELLVNGRQILSADVEVEDQYKNWLISATGFTSFFDVLLSLQYLIFFFEDRRSIVWDPDAQDELTRLFLYSTVDAQAYRTSFNFSTQADSLARNYQNILNREQKALQKAAASLQDGTNNHAQDLRLHKSLTERLTAAKSSLEDLESQHRALVQQQLSHDSELLDLQEQIAVSRDGVLSELFPALEDYGAIVLSRMQTERLCIVCGSEDKAFIDVALETLTKDRQCPCCETPLQVPKVSVSPKGQAQAAAKLDTLHQKRLQLRKALDGIRLQIHAIHELVTAKGKEVAQIQLEYEPVNLRVETAKAAQLTPDRQKRISSLQEGMEAAQADREKHLTILRDISQRHEKETKRTIDRIAKEFDEIISELLAEKCQLSASIAEMRVGEGQSDLRVLAPRFIPMMTSATSPQVPLPRRSPDTVSESQRDLIDFAFRLAFLRVAAASQPVSILIDTPESSLDSVFIPKFAKLLIAEGSRPGKAARRFVVTANLTGSPMIAKLLNKTGTKKLTRVQKQHVLYLIDQTAASASVRRHLKDYERDFDRAIQAG